MSSCVWCVHCHVHAASTIGCAFVYFAVPYCGGLYACVRGASLIAQWVSNPPVMQETEV